MEAPRTRPAPAPFPVTRRASAWRGLVASFRVAWDGVIETALHQRNMRIHLVAGLWVGLLGSAATLTVGERLALLLCVFLVLSGEVANSALEALVDLVTRERHDLARAAKDAGAGAVLVLASGSVAVLAIVLVRARGLLAAAGGELWRQVALGMPLTLLMVALLMPVRRPRAADVAFALAGVALLLAIAIHSVSAVFTALAALLFVVAAAVAFRRRTG